MNVVILDLESRYSAESCLYCHEPRRSWEMFSCVEHEENDGGHMTIGWRNYTALGLSIGCYWDYTDHRIHWFDEHTVGDMVRQFVERTPLMVTYNGLTFDLPLLASFIDPVNDFLREAWARLSDSSYDILDEIWRADPERKFERGLNSLDAIAQANGLGAKLSNGAQAPRDWAAARYADVLNYCQSDVYLTKALFEQVCGLHGTEPGILMRRDGPLEIRAPLMTPDGKLAWGQRVW